IQSGEMTAGSAFNDCRYVLDLWEFVPRQVELLHAIHFTISLKGPHDGFLEMKNICLISDLRHDIMLQKDVMEHYGIGASVFTSHGGGFYLGVRHMPEPASVDLRCLIERKENPQYCFDLLKEHQIHFFNTHNHTTVSELKAIDDLVCPNCLSDGTLIYDFARYQYIPKNILGREDHSPFTVEGKTYDPSFVDFLGKQIQGCLGELKERGQGALLYCHTLATIPPHRNQNLTIETAFNAETHEALARISNLYYNLSGKVKDRERLYIAPTSVLLRLSQVLKEIGYHGWYGEEKNTVCVESWYDPVTQTQMPNPRYGIRELRGLTFYVRDSHSAKLLVDGRECFELIRNPPDETGEESITVADMETPLPLLGKVPLPETGMEFKTENIRYEAMPVPAALPECSGHRFHLQGESGTCRLTLPPVSLAHWQFIAYRFRKSNGRSSYRLEILLSNGMKLSVCEDSYPDTGQAWSVKAWDRPEERVVVLPVHWLITALPPGDRQVPCAAISRIHLGLAGESGSDLELDYLRLLRECDTPVYDAACMIGGNVGGDADPASVLMKFDGKSYEAQMTSTRDFLFHKKVPKNSIVEIWGRTPEGQRVVPRGGPYVEILTHRTDICF
ncbi:MAG: hypothetical protein PHS88_10825, partial [Candidatus Omnitrophica bacterium]|nr:hypothetical protein [Candidatus Omnitrophota bacterium]